MEGERRRETAYLRETRVILINSVGGRNDGAHLQGVFHFLLASRLVCDIYIKLCISFLRCALIKIPRCLMIFALVPTWALVSAATASSRETDDIVFFFFPRVIYTLECVMIAAYLIGDESICARNRTVTRAPAGLINRD